MSSLVAIICFVTGLLMCLTGETAIAEGSQTNGDYLVLLHGMGRTALSMKLMEHYFTRRGYKVINLTYRSRLVSLDELADKYLDNLLKTGVTDHGKKVHFVTHSLGGIIVRQYLSNHKIRNLGRVVMLAPPNQGSEIIDRLRANCLTRNFLGVTARELGTGSDSMPQKLGPVNFQCGIIAGDFSLNPVLSFMLSGPNDGKVTVASTRVDGMQDFLVVHGTHTWMMCKRSVMDQSLRFLQSGHFSQPN
ncbi:MAG TPA: alpha/beta fold hydrolase [Verrucomicrobiae bacterium]|nr:alpha/beta fold hydrolase [Verrucomicrobiae bacterium]